jgi:hypothetical protein
VFEPLRLGMGGRRQVGFAWHGWRTGGGLLLNISISGMGGRWVGEERGTGS